jgi:hypothetical protein
MGWEMRGGTRVYYRKQRDPDTGRVRSIYCGSGERGELAAREDRARRGLVDQPAANRTVRTPEAEGSLKVSLSNP